MKKITIAIDGYSSTGKSTLAKQLAKALGYVYVDTGAMYRAVTLYALKNNLISSSHFDGEQLCQQLNKIFLKFVFNEDLGFAEMYLNDENVEKQIRTIEVSNFVSKVAELSEVRSNLVSQQQAFGMQKGVVMDGRDIGTVVFPNAELKIFMTASPEIRAKRRYDELLQIDSTISYEEVYKNVIDRDEIDTKRIDSPLVQAKDAIVLDNSELSKKEQFEIIYKLALNKIQE